MRLKIALILILYIVSLQLSGQNDPEAIKVLDSFSQKALAAPSVSMKFILINSDQMEDTNDTLSGSIILSKDSYKLDLPDNIIWYNGLTSWSYLTAEKEVTITEPDLSDESFQNKPSLIFSMYKSGFKSRLIEETSLSYIIDLYPEDIKNDLLRVRLSIGKALLDLKTLEYKRRDGIVLTLNVNEYNLRVKPDSNSFIFPAGKYKGVEIIDMR